MTTIYSITDVETDNFSTIARLTYTDDFYWQKSAKLANRYSPECKITARHVTAEYAARNCQDSHCQPLVLDQYGEIIGYI